MDPPLQLTPLFVQILKIIRNTPLTLGGRKLWFTLGQISTKGCFLCYKKPESGRSNTFSFTCVCGFYMLMDYLKFISKWKTWRGIATTNARSHIFLCYWSLFLSQYPWKQKTRGFLMTSGGVQNENSGMKWLKAFNLINSKTDLESYLSFFRKYSLLLPIRCTILVLRHTKSFRIINSTNFQNMALISSMEIREMNTLTN